MKRTLALLLALTMLFALAACGKQAEPAAEPTDEPEAVEEVELIVFAAASMTETLTELKAMYEADHPGVTITYNFDSSGTLKTQIQEGADCDLFISAAPKQMNQLDASCDAEQNPEGLDFVLQDSRIDLLLCVISTQYGIDSGIRQAVVDTLYGRQRDQRKTVKEEHVMVIPAVNGREVLKQDQERDKARKVRHDHADRGNKKVRTIAHLAL